MITRDRVVVVCPGCWRRLSASATVVGKRVRCRHPDCGTTFEVPAAGTAAKAGTTRRVRGWWVAAAVGLGLTAYTLTGAVLWQRSASRIGTELDRTRAELADTRRDAARQAADLEGARSVADRDARDLRAARERLAATARDLTDGRRQLTAALAALDKLKGESDARFGPVGKSLADTTAEYIAAMYEPLGDKEAVGTARLVVSQSGVERNSGDSLYLRGSYPTTLGLDGKFGPPEIEGAGSLWFVGQGGITYRSQELIEGRVYRFDEPKKPRLTAPGEYTLWVNFDAETSVYPVPDPDSTPIYRLRPKEKAQLLTAGRDPRSWSKVQIGGGTGRVGWVTGGFGMDFMRKQGAPSGREREVVRAAPPPPFVASLAAPAIAADLGDGVKLPPAGPLVIKQRQLPAGTKGFYLGIRFDRKIDVRRPAVELTRGGTPVELGNGGGDYIEDHRQTGERVLSRKLVPKSGTFPNGHYQARATLDGRVVAVVNWSVGVD